MQNGGRLSQKLRVSTAPTYRIRYVIDESMVWVGFLLWGQPYWLFTNLVVFHWSDKGLKAVCFKLRGVIQRGGFKESFKSRFPLDAGEEPMALHRYVFWTRSILVLPILYFVWTYWCLGRPRWTYTPVLYTGLLCKGCWDGGAPLSPPICGRIHLFSFPGNLDLNQFKWY